MLLLLPPNWSRPQAVWPAGDCHRAQFMLRPSGTTRDPKGGRSRSNAGRSKLGGRPWWRRPACLAIPATWFRGRVTRQPADRWVPGEGGRRDAVAVPCGCSSDACQRRRHLSIPRRAETTFLLMPRRRAPNGLGSSPRLSSRPMAVGGASRFGRDHYQPVVHPCARRPCVTKSACSLADL